MPKYAKIIVDISHESVDRPFTYRIPVAIHDRIAVGSCVRIPFGRGNKLLKGYVVALTEQADFPDEKIKEIESGEIQSINENNSIAEIEKLNLYWNGGYHDILGTYLPANNRLTPRFPYIVE